MVGIFFGDWPYSTSVYEYMMFELSYPEVYVIETPQCSPNPTQTAALSLLSDGKCWS